MRSTHQQFAAGLVLIGEAGGIDGRELHQKILFGGKPVVDGLHGVVGELVVVALVADGGSEFGLVLEVLFPVIVKDAMKGLGAIGGRGGRSIGGFELRGEECGWEEKNGEEHRDKWFQQSQSS